MEDYYKIFDLTPAASEEEIRKQFTLLINAWHPDKFSDPDQKKIAHEKTIIILEARKVLLNRDKRAEYDSKYKDQAYRTHSQSQQTPPHVVPPDIRISKSSISFGYITQGQTRSESFIITNSGGPANNYRIEWNGHPFWAEIFFVENPTTIFPVVVTINILANAPTGVFQDRVIVMVDGKIWGEIPVYVSIASPVQQPYSHPSYTPPSSPPTSTASSQATYFIGGSKLKTLFAILIFFLSLVMPITGLIYGMGRWDSVTILLVMGGIFVVLFVGGVLILLTVKDFSWLTASLPFLFSGLYTVLPDLPGSVDDAAVTSAGALITYFLTLRKKGSTPRWIIVPLLAAAAYTLLGGNFLPGPVDEVLVDILALLIAGFGSRAADHKADLDESPTE